MADDLVWASWDSDCDVAARVPAAVAQDLPAAERDIQPPLLKHARPFHGLDDGHVLRLLRPSHAHEPPSHVPQSDHTGPIRRPACVCAGMREGMMPCLRLRPCSLSHASALMLASTRPLPPSLPPSLPLFACLGEEAGGRRNARMVS